MRLPIEEFAQNQRLVDAFRKGVAGMKARRASDPLSWFFQAAIHGVTPAAKAAAASGDPEVNNVPEKYWNQCPHFGQESANFLPWHRGYTYYFEQILRMHSGEADFALPYWDYTQPGEARKFPRILGVEHLDGDLNNNAPANINPLFHKERDFYFTSYEHPLTDKVPLLTLSDEAVDISPSMNSPVFFGATEREGLGGGVYDKNPATRGLMESYPHDQIHRSVGGIIGDYAGAMATPPTAAFDPAFPVHHANVDRLWRIWSAMPGKSWGVLPAAGWFDESPWIFFDTSGREVVRPRRDYFDLRPFGVTFKGLDANEPVLELPTRLPSRRPTRAASAPIAVSTGPGATLSPRTATTITVGARSAATRTNARERVLLRLSDVRLTGVRATGFDVHLVGPSQAALNRSAPSFLGSLALFVHAEGEGHGHGDHGGPREEQFDATRALASLAPQYEGPLKVLFKPYALLVTDDLSAPIASDAPRVGGVVLQRVAAPG